jgi:hypothetical protein
MKAGFNRTIVLLASLLATTALVPLEAATVRSGTCNAGIYCDTSVGDDCDICPVHENPVAADKATLVWDHDEDIEYVRGLLAEVASYAILESGSRGMVAVLDLALP